MATSSLGAITSPGIGSGLDINSIISKLMTVEEQPLTALTNREASYKAQLSAFGSLQSDLATFKSAMDQLNSAATMNPISTSVSDPTLFTATADSTATAATHSISVTQLAQAQTIVSPSSVSIADPTATPIDSSMSAGSATINITVGLKAPVAITIDSTNNTLDGVRDAINNANCGVSASIINDGTTNRLVLTGTATGAANAFTVTVSDPNAAPNGSNVSDSNLIDLVSYPPVTGSNGSATATSTAQDANLTVDGIPVTRSTNTISDLIQGVTLTLDKVSAPNTSATLNISQDTSAMTASVNNFVKAYNTLNQQISQLTAYDTTTNTGSALTGNSTVFTVQQQLQQGLSDALTTSTGTFSYLFQIGVSLQKDGTLSVDSTTLQNAMTTDFKSVGQVLGAGFAARFSSIADQLTTTGGLISSSTDGINASITDLDNQINAFNDRMTQVQANYTAQFTALDTLVASFNQTSTYLTQQLASLPKAG